MNDPKKLLEEATLYCTQLLKSHLPSSLVFHNYTHTRAVAKAALEIGTNSGLSEEELQALLVAAWFHDTGYCRKYKGHEDVSKELAAAFLHKQGAASSFQRQVASCIDATKQPQQPQNLLGQIICDADMSHLGSASFIKASLKLKKELELVKGEHLSESDWHRQNLHFLQQHNFFTTYAKVMYDPQKDKNILKELQLLR
ncbi:HD domain-containing protein [Pontibacter chitinilyticus]|uniref:HD domain-containing protein n=1 Tax=Pontibacter chitinilyticus TaxID=2674989 RepID=UPI00321A1835